MKPVDHEALLEVDQQEKPIVQKLPEVGNGQIAACLKKRKSPAQPVMPASEKKRARQEPEEPTRNKRANATLNPVVEAHQLFEATDQDEMVMEAKEAQEESASSNETDANLADDPVEPVPTRIEALQAALLLQEYTKHLDDPIARKLETMLSSFGRMTRTSGVRNMKETDPSKDSK